MTEPTVQVPVSLLREIKESLGFDRGYDHPLTERVDALLSQPSPTAEHNPDWSDWSIDHPEEGPNCSCGFNGSFEECAESRAADPPSIADMVPGTTFTASEVCGDEHQFAIAPSGRILPSLFWTVDSHNIDPSTIRDVTPPKEPS